MDKATWKMRHVPINENCLKTNSLFLKVELFDRCFTDNSKRYPPCSKRYPPFFSIPLGSVYQFWKRPPVPNGFNRLIKHAIEDRTMFKNTPDEMNWLLCFGWTCLPRWKTRDKILAYSLTFISVGRAKTHQRERGSLCVSRILFTSNLTSGRWVSLSSKCYCVCNKPDWVNTTSNGLHFWIVVIEAFGQQLQSVMKKDSLKNRVDFIV